MALEVRIYDLTLIRERRFYQSAFFSKAKPNFRGEATQPPFGVNSFLVGFFLPLFWNLFQKFCAYIEKPLPIWLSERMAKALKWRKWRRMGHLFNLTKGITLLHKATFHKLRSFLLRVALKTIQKGERGKERKRITIGCNKSRLLCTWSWEWGSQSNLHFDFLWSKKRQREILSLACKSFCYCIVQHCTTFLKSLLLLVLDFAYLKGLAWVKLQLGNFKQSEF